MPDSDGEADADMVSASPVKKIICSRNGICLKAGYPPFCPCGNEVKCES
jgi:hypothetical protein